MKFLRLPEFDAIFENTVWSEGWLNAQPPSNKSEMNVLNNKAETKYAHRQI